jgi:hypothetical protein
VLKSGADVGIALDGDGDRIVMVDADGDVLRRRQDPLRDRQGRATQRAPDRA